MATKNWDDDFMSQIIDEAAWEKLSGEAAQGRKIFLIFGFTNTL